MLVSPESLFHTSPKLRECLSEFLTGLTDHRPLGVAVSGGSDSLGLLHCLASLASPGKLVGLTVDHGLRAGSDNEAREVKAHCRRLGLRHETLRWDEKPPASGLQAAARRARYRLLGSAAQRLGLAAVLTAHTRDDQQETLEMRRARSLSANALGLAGIPRATLFGGRMWVLRPLLAVGRAEIRDYLRDARVEWIDDPSNSDTRFERVRVRGLLSHRNSGPLPADGSEIAAVRSSRALMAADYLDANCRSEADGLVRLRLRASENPEVIATAIEALIDLCGGAGRPLDRRGKATLGATMRGWAEMPADEGHVQAVTLGRTLVRRRGGDLLIRRERRGIGTLELEPGHSAVWDGRYRIHNLDRNTVLHANGGGSHGVLPSFSRYLTGRRHEWDEAGGVAGGFLCQRLTGRSSCILPVYELPLAQSLARVVGAEALPECPWHGSKA